TVERGDGTTVFDDIYADGEMRSRHGPLRVDGVFRRDGRRWSLRASTGQFSEASGRLRVVLEQTAAGRRFEADGQLLVGGPSPRFEGKVIAAHRPVADTANGTGWQISANAKAENRVVLDGIQLSLGRDASPTDLAGEVEFEPWPGGR